MVREDGSVQDIIEWISYCHHGREIEDEIAAIAYLETAGLLRMVPSRRSDDLELRHVRT